MAAHVLIVGRLSPQSAGARSARADDGLPEAVEVAAAGWAVGVQWHPEDAAAHDAEQQALFDELLARAGSRGAPS